MSPGRRVLLPLLIAFAATTAHAFALQTQLARTPTSTSPSCKSPLLPTAPADPINIELDATYATTSAIATTITHKPAQPSTTAVYTASSLFTSAILNSTNVYRREHNASVVHWNATLARFATTYLEGDTACNFAHSGGGNGENIAIGFSTPEAVVEAWGNERARYDFDHPAFSKATGHFTQLVWKNTTTVGCGRIFCSGFAHNQKNTGWFVACEYWPRGNIIGQFGDMVGRQVSGSFSPDPSRSSGTAPGTRPPGRTSSMGVVAGAVVVFVLLAAAFGRDVAVALADP